MATREEAKMKDLSSTKYEPSEVESGWQAWWEENGFFKPRNAAKKFVLPIPPPNITGKLHIGHALMLSLQDAVTRYKRMCGYETLYLPGTDHAGIATQAVLEKNFKAKENRGEFLERAWEWQKTYESHILNQLRRMGGSCDFSRTRFTLDLRYCDAVTEAFVRFYEKGLIKRSYRIVNWCAKVKTTLSDLEVDSLEVKPFEKIHADGGNHTFGVLYYVKYPVIKLGDFTARFGALPRNRLYGPENKLANYLDLLKEGGDAEISWEGFEFIEIATTRPETIIGDTALCVSDAFVQSVCGSVSIGREATFEVTETEVPYVAINPLNFNVMPVVRNKMADANFGTGNLKITPAHDASDFELHKKMDLKVIKVLDENNCIDTEGIQYWLKTPKGSEAKLRRFDCRLKVLDILRSNNLITKEEGHPMVLPICSRTGDIIEPMLRSQWWLNCDKMAQKALEATRTKKILIYPEDSNRTWERWLENIQEWCLSRQLWWGHRIPAYRVFKKDAQGGDAEQHTNKLGWVIARNIEQATKQAVSKYGKGVQIMQDDDVLDTWFSSALWPFATLGWPQKMDESYFPTSLLETGSDILFFWIARMVMCSLELCNEIPFREVFLHGIVRDANGRKMSKSLGNVIDPLFVIDGASLVLLSESLSPNLSEKERKVALKNQKTWFPNGIKECGADALRFTLCAYTYNLKDVNLDIKRVEGYRKFCNKLWNAHIFVKQSISDVARSEDVAQSLSTCTLSPATGEFLRWIETRCNETISELTKHIDSYNFMAATQVIHAFFIYDFCDVFIEVAKKKRSAGVVALTLRIFVDILKMLHPFMPFITEEIYQRLKKECVHSKDCAGMRNITWDESITIAQWPCSSDVSDTTFEKFLSFAKHLRSIVGQNKVKLVLGDGGYADEAVALVKSIKEIEIGGSSLEDFEGFRYKTVGL